MNPHSACARCPHRATAPPRHRATARPCRRVTALPRHTGRYGQPTSLSVHGRDSEQAKTVCRARSAGAKLDFVYLHSIIDGSSQPAHAEAPADEKDATAAASPARVTIRLAAHGITHIHRVGTDNGACYRSDDFTRIVGCQSRHQESPGCRHAARCSLPGKPFAL
jgi:hypothetical protein